jgi:uncharacterized membrane protein
MMFKFENSIVIDLPVDEVYDFVADLTSIPKWNYYVQSVTPTSDNPDTEGATYHQVRKNDAQNLKISRSEAGQVLVIESIPPSKPELRREMMFQADGNSTRLLDKWQLDMGVPGLLEPLAARRAKAGVKENLGKLKTLLETGKVTLQDGRSFAL